MFKLNIIYRRSIRAFKMLKLNNVQKKKQKCQNVEAGHYTQDEEVSVFIMLKLDTVEKKKTASDQWLHFAIKPITNGMFFCYQSNKFLQTKHV